MLDELKQKLNNQDNRATANPIFIVYDWERVPSCNDYTDKFMFVDDEGQIADTREDLIEWLNDLDVNVPDSYKELDDKDLIEVIHDELGYDMVEKVYYIKKRIFINVFFTEESAKSFIKQNHYHYTKEVHIYINCLWRNPEMQYIRNGLKSGLFEEEQPL